MSNAVLTKDGSKVRWQVDFVTRESGLPVHVRKFVWLDKGETARAAARRVFVENFTPSISRGPLENLALLESYDLFVSTVNSKLADRF